MWINLDISLSNGQCSFGKAEGLDLGWRACAWYTEGPQCSIPRISRQKSLGFNGDVKELLPVLGDNIDLHGPMNLGGRLPMFNHYFGSKILSKFNVVCVPTGCV